jgi:hypothetical protein
LGELLDIADDVGLDVQVTLLDGWLSGFAFFPAWKTPPPWNPPQNMFITPSTIEAEKYLFGQVAQHFAQHPRFLGFDLGNELNVLHYGDNTTTLEQADAWQAQMFEHCYQVAPDGFHVNGVDHQPWLSQTGFSRSALASQGSASVLHAWVFFTGALQAYGHAGVGSLHLTEYMIELIKAHHLDPQRPVWLQECGASQRWMPLDYIPEFAEHTIASAASCSHVWGITWWCSHDLNPALSGFDPLEYDLGLFDAKHCLKPVGERIAATIQGYKKQPIMPLNRATALVLPQSGLQTMEQSWVVGRTFMDLISDGVRPTLILESRQHDQEYLKVRGITELILLDQNG